jgi:hypothetical protein
MEDSRLGDKERGEPEGEREMLEPPVSPCGTSTAVQVPEGLLREHTGSGVRWNADYDIKG